MSTPKQIVRENATTLPVHRGYPLIGVLSMMMRDPLKLFSSAVSQHGDAVILPVGRSSYYLFNHPDHFKYVLQDHYRNFQKGTSYTKLKLLVGEGVGTSEGDSWLHQRRLLQPAFHHQRLASLATAMTDATAGLIERWQGYAARKNPIDISTEMMRLTQQIIVTTMFSTSIGAETEQVCQAFDNVLNHFSTSFWLTALPDRFNPSYRRFEQALRTLDTIVYRIIENRRHKDDSRDMLSMLLDARDEESGEGMSDRQLRDEVMTMFFAGYETTATTLTWIWHLLAAHPEVEQRLHAELADVLGGRTPTFQDLPHLVYTRMVIDEALRLFPVAWAVFRTAVADDVIGDYHIPAGSVVILSPYVLHHTPTYWEQPKRFDPDRFTPERSSDRPSYAYVPFGGGPRQCIGKNFALMEAQLILAMVAQRYQLRIAGRPAEPTIALVLRPDSRARLTVHQRSA